jgi:hypothetical protein
MGGAFDEHRREGGLCFACLVHCRVSYRLGWRPRPAAGDFGPLRRKRATLGFSDGRERGCPGRGIGRKLDVGRGKRELRIFCPAGRSLARRNVSRRSPRRQPQHDASPCCRVGCRSTRWRSSAGILPYETNWYSRERSAGRGSSLPFFIGAGLWNHGVRPRLCFQIVRHAACCWRIAGAGCFTGSRRRQTGNSAIFRPGPQRGEVSTYKRNGGRFPGASRAGNGVEQARRGALT